MTDPVLDFGTQHISPSYTREKISPGQFTDWVDVWEDRMWGWWLAHADALRGQHIGAFLIVHIAVGMIEALQVAYEGKDSDGDSARCFRDGFLRMFSASPSALSGQDAANAIYKAVRCALTHSAMLYGPVFLFSTDRMPPIQINATPDGKVMDSVFIHPEKFLDIVIAKFRSYVALLRNGEGPEADKRRRLFEAVWHQLHSRTLPATMVK